MSSPRWSRLWHCLDIVPAAQEPGVYRIHLVNSDGRPIVISRFLGEDEEGILCIGSTKNIQKRITCFRNAAEGGACKHSAGKRLNFVTHLRNFRALCAERGFEYSVMTCPNEEEARSQEQRSLERYLKKFGEVPPLNSIFPRPR